MGALIDVCTSYSDGAKELRAFQDELNGIQLDFLSDVNDVTSSQESKKVNSAADEALAEFNSLFASSSLGSLRKVQEDSGVEPSDRSDDESAASLANRGYLVANNRWFFCGTSSFPMRSTSTANVNGYQGVGDGEFTVEKIQELIPNYVEPDIEEVFQSQSPRKALGSKSFVAVSTLAPVNDGNLTRLRELYATCGYSIKATKALLQTLASSKYGIAYTTLSPIVVTKPTNISYDLFTIDYVRSVVASPLRECNMLKMSATEYLCLVEAPASSSSYDAVRVITTNTNESLRNQAPIFVSRGFDGTKLGPSSYLLGITVCGISRVVDVTSDLGNSLYSNSYDASDVASAIKSVFPDFLDSGVVGDEFYLTTKGSGVYSSLEFFQVGDFDAYRALGIEGMVKSQYDSSYTFEKPLAILGGVASQTPTSTSFVKSVKSSPMLVEQKFASLVSSHNYWRDILDTNDSDVKALLATFTTNIRKDVQSNVADLTVFQEPLSTVAKVIDITIIEDLRVWECLDILNALGSDAERVLKLVDVVEIDPYTDSDSVYNAITAECNRLQSNSGVSNVTPTATVQQPKEINTSQLRTAQLLYHALVDAYDKGDTSSALSYYDRFHQASNISIVTGSTGTASDGKTLVSSYDSFISDYVRVVNKFNPIMSIDANEVSRSTSSYVKRAYPEVYANLVASAEYLKKTYELGDNGTSNMYQDSEAVGSSSKFGLQDSSITALKKADTIMRTVQTTMQGYASTYQQTYNKIMSLSNIGMNVYGNQGFQTKYLSCYVSGSASLLLGKALEKYLSKINELADSLNKMLQKIIKALRKFFDKITCLVNSLSLASSGYLSYSKTTTGFMGIQFNMTCTMDLGSAGMGLDPQIGSLVSSILGRVIACLSIFQLQIVTFESQDSNTQAIASQAQADLMNTVRDALDRLKACIS